MNRASYAICWIVGILVAAAPLPFGSVGPVSEAGLQVGVLVTAMIWIVSRSRHGLPALPWRDPLLIAGGALLAYGLFQTVPLPASLVEIIAPATAEMKSTFSPEPPAWTPLSIYAYATWRSCLNIACWTLAALIVRHNALDLKGRLVVSGGLVAGAIFQAAYGLFEFISGHQHIFGYKKEAFTDVATGTFISRNNFAGYLEMAIPICLALAMLGLDRGRTREPDRSVPFRLRVGAITGRQGFPSLLLLMGAFLMGTAILMSRSRAGIISTVFALLVGALALALRGQFRRFAVCAVSVVALVVVFASQIHILPVLERFRQLGGEFAGGYGRLEVWKQSAGLIASYPVFGTGMGTWEMAFSPFRDDRTQLRVDFAHNDYLEFTAEAGFLGLVIFLLGALLVLRRRAHERTPPDVIGLAASLGLVALALHSLVDFHLSIPADAFTAAVLAGLFLMSGWPAPAGNDPVAPRAAAPSWRLGATACAAVLAVMGLAAVSPVAAQIGADHPSENELYDVDAGDVPAPADPYDDPCSGCRIEPFNASRYIDSARSARRRLLKDVEALLRMQAEGDLPDLSTRQYLADRLDEALALADRGLELAPASGRGHLEAGLLHFGRFALTGMPPQASLDFDRAREEFDKALRLQPWRAAAHRKVARVLTPLWGQCDDEQREFIARVARRTLQIDPYASDIRDAVARMDS